jgi:NADP-dependent aldehyde dehydrogenase
MAEPIRSIDPRTGLPAGIVALESSPAAVDEAVRASLGAAPALVALGIEGRARLLESMADELEADREELVPLADRETALGPVRLNGELTRTVYQLRFMTSVVRDGACLEVVIDHEDDTPMGRLADVRRVMVPMGPVAMFGAGNFPFAFSVAGGDTAAAVAAGCPVIAKAHSSHPALSAAVHRSLLRACSRAGAPEATVGLVFGRPAGNALVTHPGVRAVAFTGSTAGGRALFDLAVGRPDPIPFYGELGSLNPVAVTPAAAAERATAIAEGWVGSFTLGAGQFCTKPGLALVPVGPDGDVFRDAAVAKVASIGSSWMLNGAMRDAYEAGTGRLAEVPDAVIHRAPGLTEATGFAVMPTLVEATTADLRAHGSPLLDECFGPAAVLARYTDTDDLLDALGRMDGSLTASIHVGEGETDLPARLLEVAAAFAGRVLVNGYPTGVAVDWAMQHGGPWPATTSAGHTSVGATSIRRFLRPVSYQGVPDALLPPELRDANPLGLPRRVDGRSEVPAADGRTRSRSGS